LLLFVLFSADVGIMPLNTKGFKDTTTHDFMFKAARAHADSLPTSMKSISLLSHYVRVYLPDSITFVIWYVKKPHRCSITISV